VNDQAAEVLRTTEPFADRERASERHELVSEALFLIEQGEPLPMQSFADLGPVWDRIERGGSAAALELRDAARLLRVAEALRRHLNRFADKVPTLTSVCGTSADLGPLLVALARSIDDHGQIEDAASAELAAARRRKRGTEGELRKRQQTLVNTYSELLSGQFFAEREGRYVLPVRSDSIGRIEGLVLGSSASGGTLYVEPRELTALCNRLRVEEARVVEEEQAVLRQLSTLCRDLLPLLRHANAALVAADVARALSTWAARHKARPIRFSDEALLDLRGFRHPLLLDGSHAVVANDIALAAGQCLVLSGPNAGGKTVALECLGLAAWMARAGLPLPCDELTVVGWFDEVVTDIGDGQSLSQSLSTFSAHITHIAEALERAGPRSLVLIDELASGTDPDEGAALAEAILSAFLERGAAISVTTHYERLKRLGAGADARFVNASVGFDVALLRPTFRLAVGVPGMSAAFAVAARFGLPEAVVAHGRELLPQARVDQQLVMEQLESERQRLSEARETTEREAHAALRLREQTERERERAYQEERKRLEQEARELWHEVRQARSLLGHARKLLAENKPEKELLKEVEALIGKAATPVALGGAVVRALERDEGVAPAEHAVTPGMTVQIPHLKAEGQVLEVPGRGGVRVLVGGLRMLVPLDKLRLARGGQPKRPPKRASGPTPAPTTREMPVRTPDTVCDLRGARVEAGLQEVDQFIDRLFRRNEFAAFILHGHGTGAMKAAVREHLAASTHVDHFEPAPRDDGGDALTVFWLRG
jgi:DNA mismatch repair protein MutS2